MIPISLVFFLFIVGGISALLSSKGIQMKLSILPFPLHDPDGIVVDSQGNIYCSIPFYSRLQKYSPEGSFLNSWMIGTSGGKSLIKIDNDVIHVCAVRGQKTYAYNTDGALLETGLCTATEEDWNRDTSAIDNRGNTYDIRSRFTFPKIVRTNEHDRETLIISNPWFMKILNPLPLCSLAILGLIVYSRVDRENREEDS